MSISTIGDMRQFFMSTRANAAIKTELNTLVQELTSGQVSDLTAHLGGSQTNLAGLDRQLQMLERFSQTNKDTSQLLATMQTVLGAVDDNRALASSALLTIDQASPPTQIRNAGSTALSGFETTVNALNTRFGDRMMFGGNELDQSSLAAPDIMLDALRVEVAGIANEADFKAAIDNWFDAPGGGFETLGYQGDASDVMTRPVGPNQTIDIDVRADDQTLRDTLKAFAVAGLAAESGASLLPEAQRNLQQQAGLDLLANAAPLAALQGRLGYVEGQVEEAAVRVSSQETSYSIARNDLVSADPFETATRLQAVQQQLETQFTLTARLSRLSLTEYLR